MIWADVTDPLVLSTIETGCADPTYVVPTTPDPLVVQCLQIASDTLTRLTGYAIHPAGEAIEELRGESSIRRISPNYRPVREVISVKRVKWDGTSEELDTSGWVIIGQSVYFSASRCTLGQWWRPLCSCEPNGETIQFEYRFGSTVNAGARAAVLWFAHQLWQSCNGNECELPERVTSVNREGLSYSVIDPMQFLDKFQTGIPRVDLWINSINPAKAKRPAGVYTPDAPPPVNRRIRVI